MNQPPDKNTLVQCCKKQVSAQQAELEPWTKEVEEFVQESMKVAHVINAASKPICALLNLVVAGIRINCDQERAGPVRIRSSREGVQGC